MSRNFDICIMKILLVAATNLELEPVLDHCPNTGHQLMPLSSGIGSLQTCFQLCQNIALLQPDWVIQVGIGGSFRPNLLPGSVVGISSEYLGDLGVEESEDFSDAFDMGFIQPNQVPFHQKALVNPYWDKIGYKDIKLEKAVTVNEISTSPSRIQSLLQRYQPGIESMEGAALHLACLQLNQPFLQLRAVSNLVGERNKSHWNIPLALKNLAIQTQSLLTFLS